MKRFSTLISGCHAGGAPKRTRIAAGTMLAASTGGRWESRPTTGRSSGLKERALTAQSAGRRACAGRQWSPLAAARRLRAANFAAELACCDGGCRLPRQASFSLIRADLPERLRR